MGCGDLCTAAKCAELEYKIAELQFQIDGVLALLNDHLLHDIPTAHAFTPEVTVTTNLNDSNLLTTQVDINGVADASETELTQTEQELSFEIVQQDATNYLFTLTLAGTPIEQTLTIEKSELDFVITPTNPTEYDFAITYGTQAVNQQLNLSDLETSNQDQSDQGQLKIDVDYLFDVLKVTVSHGSYTDTDWTYIDADTINYGSGGGGNNTGDDDVGCSEIGEALQFDLASILQAIAAVDSKVTKVQEYVTIDVEGTTITEFECVEKAPEGEEQPLPGTEKEYEGKGIAGLHELLKITLNNQLAIFEETCASGGELAFPAWWQVRLGANVPQIVCSFRKAGTSTYHYLAIPHPANTSKPTKALLPAYTKGNWQGMVTCRDNSKFIINCNTKAEAERMCGLAAQLIDSDYLELPPRIYVGERKGQGVGVDSMTPSTINYYKTGQQNFVPICNI